MLSRGEGGMCCPGEGGVVQDGGGREGGVVTWSRGGVLLSTPPSPPPFSDRMTNTCENITLARFATRRQK